MDELLTGGWRAYRLLAELQRLHGLSVRASFHLWFRLGVRPQAPGHVDMLSKHTAAAEQSKNHATYIRIQLTWNTKYRYDFLENLIITYNLNLYSDIIGIQTMAILTWRLSGRPPQLLEMLAILTAPSLAERPAATLGLSLALKFIFTR